MFDTEENINSFFLSLVCDTFIKADYFSFSNKVKQ